MDTLPKHIADMCGIMDQALERLALTRPTYQSVQKETGDDDLVQISYRGAPVGWISEIKSERGPKYRALTANNRINRFYTENQAMNWLIEEAF